MPETVKSIVKEPSQLKKIPSAIREGGKKFGKLAMISPGLALAKIGTEVLLLKGTGKVFSVTGKLTSKTAAKVTGKLRKVKGGKIIISKTKTGLTLSTRAAKKRVVTPKGLFLEKKTVRITAKKRKGLKIGIARPGLKKILVPAREQAKLAGKKLPIVTSAQASKLVGLIRRRRVVRKPIPGERLFTPRTRQLLKEFDRGKISEKNFIKLNKRVIKESKGKMLEFKHFQKQRYLILLKRN